MKKRILAALICAVIVMLSGCSGTETPKPVESKDEFFSRIAGIYTDLSYSDEYNNTTFQIFKDGSFLIYNNRLTDISTIKKGCFQTVYSNDELSYNTSVSKLTSPMSISLSYFIFISFNPVHNLDLNPIGRDKYNSDDICSNDRFDIYYPGASTDYLPVPDENRIIGFDEYGDSIVGTNFYDYDTNSDNKLDYTLLHNHETDHIYKETSSDYLIENCLLVDYTSEAPIIKVYNFNKGSVEVTRYSLSNDSITEYEPQHKSDDPYYYIAIRSTIIMMNDKEEHYLSVVTDQDKMRVPAQSSCYTGIKNDYYLYLYDTLPDYNTLVKDSVKAVSEQKQLNN